MNFCIYKIMDLFFNNFFRYKITFKRFDLEYSENCDSDYLTIYDTEIASTCFSAPAGKFCGNSKPNITGFPTQQFVTLKFRTDSGTGRKGFRIMATRTLPCKLFEIAFEQTTHSTLLLVNYTKKLLNKCIH